MRFISTFMERNCGRRRCMLAAALLLVCACLPHWCLAAACAGTPTVSVSASGVAFGNYNPLSAAATTGNGTVTVTATCGLAFSSQYTLSYTIALSTGSSGSFTTRTLTSGGNSLQYNLFTAAQLATIWGDGSGGSQTVAGNLTGSCQLVFWVFYNCNTPVSQNYTAYADIPAMQNVAAGSYTDSITVTVNF